LPVLVSCNRVATKAAQPKNEMDHAMPGITQTDSMDHDMMRHLDNGMSNMKSMKMTGDFDLDFANMMIVHHQAAIDMSEIEIAKGR
jgi:uncharacterized protein (DUF305 family)